MDEDLSRQDLLAHELRSLVGHGVTESKAEAKLSVLRSALGVPENLGKGAAVRAIKKELLSRLHGLSGEYVIFANGGTPIPSARLTPAYECLFHLTQPVELKNPAYRNVPQYDRRRLYAMNVLQVRFSARDWRAPNGPEYELMTVLAESLLSKSESESDLKQRGKIDREDITYFLDAHGCVVKSEHLLAVTATTEGWKRIGPLIRPIPKSKPFPTFPVTLNEDGKLVVDEASSWGPFMRQDAEGKVIESDEAQAITGQIPDFQMPIGAESMQQIMSPSNGMMRLEIDLPPLSPGQSHTLAWHAEYMCRVDAFGPLIEHFRIRKERAEVFYVAPVGSCNMRLVPDMGADLRAVRVERYEDIYPGMENHWTRDDVACDSDGTYSASFQGLSPFRYYGLEWIWRHPE